MNSTTIDAGNASTVRFVVGRSYRLHTSPIMPNLAGGRMTVIAELAPRDRWGNRTLLVDAQLIPANGRGTRTERLGVSCFVEEGYADVVGSYGGRTIPVEIATLQGIYPLCAKAYAHMDVRT